MCLVRECMIEIATFGLFNRRLVDDRVQVGAFIGNLWKCVDVVVVVVVVESFPHHISCVYDKAYVSRHARKPDSRDSRKNV